MFSLLHVVLLRPVQGEFHRVDELLVVECVFGVTRYIETVQLCQQFHELLVIHPVIDRDHAGTTGLQILSMRCLEESSPFIIIDRFIPQPHLRDRLREDSEDRVVGLRSEVVTSLQKDRLCIVAAHVMGSSAICNVNVRSG